MLLLRQSLVVSAPVRPQSAELLGRALSHSHSIHAFRDPAFGASR